MTNPHFLRDLHQMLYPEQHGPRWSRLLHQLGDRMEEFACRRSGIDPMNSDELCTGFYGRMETLGVDLKAGHRRRIR